LYTLCFNADVSDLLFLQNYKKHQLFKPIDAKSFIHFDSANYRFYYINKQTFLFRIEYFSGLKPNLNE